jgi:hypothetical protein
VQSHENPAGQYLATGKVEERAYLRRRYTGSFTSLGHPNMSGWRGSRWRTSTTCARRGRIENGGFVNDALRLASRT